LAFTRLGFADEDTSPIEWAVSGGLGGRGVIPSRDNDTFGLGYYYQSIQKTLLTSALGIGDSAQGFEGFYNIALTPASRVTLDLQVVEPALARLSTGTVLGLRVSLDF
jgi:porin